MPLLQFVHCFLSHQCKASRKFWLCPVCNLLLGVRRWYEELPEKHQLLVSFHVFQPPSLLLSSFSVPFLSQEAQAGCRVPGVLLQVPDGGVVSLPQTFWQWSCTTQEGADHLHSLSVPLTPLHSSTRALQDFFNFFKTTGTHPSQVQGFVFASVEFEAFRVAW